MSEVADFAEITRQYCAWVERSGDADDALAVQKVLCQLQLAVLNLPAINGDDDYSETDTQEDDWKTVQDRLHALPVNGYWSIFDPFADGEQPVFSTLPDDLADIYADLKEGLSFYDEGNESEAIWRWRFSYFTHWGRHLTAAQTALYAYLADKLV